MNKHQKKFINLLKAGLWNTAPDASVVTHDTDWDEILRLAVNQTVLGFITNGVLQMPKEERPPKNIYFNLIKKVSDIEQRNDKMNIAVPQLMKKLQEQGCPTILMKGQGAAMNYLTPQYRQAGDIDLFVGFDEDVYNRTNEAMATIATHIGHNNQRRRHADYVMGDIVVEIHGNVSCCISKQCDAEIGAWARERLQDKNEVFRSRLGDIVVPPRNFDAIYIFVHMLNHFMGGGVGLRQVSDWMMYLNKHHDKINADMLTSDIKRLGIEKAWRLFASVAVVHFDFPRERMPLYDETFDKKSELVLDHIFKTGNFGALQKEAQLSNDANRVLKKIVTFFGQIPVYFDLIKLFPKETFYCFGRFIKTGAASLQD